MFAPLQWHMCTPLLLMEFVLVSYMILDIPAEHTLTEFGSELMRRASEALTKYNSCYEDDGRVLEEPRFKYSTPYNNMVMTHMVDWNNIVINAIKCPATLDKRYALGANNLMKKEIIQAQW